MINFWRKIPEQVKRLSLLLAVLVVVFIIVRSELVPSDFGEYGHYRASALNEIAAQEIHYAGQEVCNECHDDVMETKNLSYHENVSCEVCHGPAADHADDPDSFLPDAPRERNYCPVCHEYLPSRPTGFPQIIATSHNPVKPCITCHDPHDPKPPNGVPTSCKACHAEIVNTKSLSHHAYVKCVQCHETPEDHKLNPRKNVSGKPRERALCGSCHSVESESNKGIPRIDLITHEPRYVCWQCHYPHLPEAK